MKILYTILILILSFLKLHAQELAVDSTRFITGNNPLVEDYNAIPTNDKGILLVGYSYLNPGGIIPPFFDTINKNALIVKIDSTGRISWVKVYGGSSDDVAVYACQTPDGGYAIAGAAGTSDGDLTGLEYRGGGDVWLLRLDASGNLLWGNTYGSSDDDFPFSIANTPDHGFVILGCSNGDDYDVPFHYGDVFSYDWIVVKTDSLGNMQWCRDLGGSSYEDQYGSILSIDSSYYLVSESMSTDYDCTDSFWHLGANTLEDIYVLKLNDTGAVLWDSSYGGGSYDGACSAVFDIRDSSIMVSGWTSSFDYMVTRPADDCEPGDMWVLKIAKSGRLLWGKTLGSVQEEAGYSICSIPNNGYAVVGATAPGAEICIDSALGDIGGTDCWLFLLDSAGNTLTSKVFGGQGDETPYAVLPFGNGYAVCGYSTSDSFSAGSNYGNFDTTGGGFITYLSYWPLAVSSIQTPVSKMSVYPNPTTDGVNIMVAGQGKLIIVSSIGQQVYSAQTDKGSIAIDVRGWSNGMYFVLWQGEDGSVQTAKLVKE